MSVASMEATTAARMDEYWADLKVELMGKMLAALMDASTAVSSADKMDVLTAVNWVASMDA